MEMDFGELDQVLNKLFNGNDEVSFTRLVEYFTSEDFQKGGILGFLAEWLKLDAAEYKMLFLTFLGIAIGAALLAGFTDVFQNKQVSETSFYIIYLLLFTSIMVSFQGAFNLAEKAIGSIMQFMEALVPTFFLSVAFCTGSSAAMLLYEGALVLITLVDRIILHVLLPFVHIYLLFMLINEISGEESFSKLADLFRQAVGWLMKTMMAVILGFQTIQALLLPAGEKVKRSMLYKTAKMIPGVGNIFGNVTETVLETGVLLKNAIGAAGLLVLVLICLIPLIKLALQFLVCKLSAGVLQPVTDKRILNCFSASAEALRLLLYLVAMSALLFGLTIVIVAASTSSP